MDARKLALTIATTAVFAAGAGSSVALARTPPRAVDPGERVTIAEGQAVRLSTKDLTVRYARLVADSGGDKAIAVQLSAPGRGERWTSVLHTAGPRTATYEGETVELLGVRGDRITVRVG